MFMIGANCLVRCWYSGCSLIVQSIKYLLYLFLCVDGCVCRMFGMGPGLVSMSPPSSISKCEKNSRIMSGVFCFLWFAYHCFLLLLLLLFVVSYLRVVMYFGCLVCFLCVCVLCVVLYWFIFLNLFI